MPVTGLVDTLTDLEKLLVYEVLPRGGVHPNEDEMLTYIKSFMKKAEIPVREDAFGNLVAYVTRGIGPALGIVVHVDIAKPVDDTREIIISESTIHTDGRHILGGDNLNALAAVLQLVKGIKAGDVKLARPLELVFTRGEEAGILGAMNLDWTLISFPQALVFDWTGGVFKVITTGRAYGKFTCLYTGESAHSSRPEDGTNAGLPMILALARVKQGRHQSGMTVNVGRVEIGEARNALAKLARVEIEVRSHDDDEVEEYLSYLKDMFEMMARAHEVRSTIDIPLPIPPSYKLNKEWGLLKTVVTALAAIGYKPVYVESDASFDVSPLAAQGIEAINLGGAYLEPHGEREKTVRDWLAGLLRFMEQIVTMPAA